MTLIVVLICIALQRLLHFRSYPYHFNWIEPYSDWVIAKTKNISGGHGLLGLILLVLPLLLLLSLLFAVIFHLLGIVGYAIANIVLLWYCLDAQDFRQEPQDFNNSSALLLLSYRVMFGPLFWYIFFGPVGLVLYFIIMELRKFLETHPEKADPKWLSAVIKTQAVLDWLPQRILGLTYALAGNFLTTFKSLQQDFFSGITNGGQRVVEWGLAAQTHSAETSEYTVTETLALIDRALVIWLVILLITTLSFWI